MRETIIKSIGCGYAISIALLCLHLYRMYRNPEKYDQIPGWERYKHSKFFWPATIPYERFDFAHHVLPSSSWLVPLLFIVYIRSQIYIHSLGSTLPCLTFRFTPPYLMLLEICVLLFGSFAFAGYLALHSRLPRDICYTTVHMQQGDPRHKVWKKTTLQLIVCLVILCPLHLFSLSNGGYINETALVCYRGFSAEQTVYEFSEIKSCEITYNETEKEIVSYIIENSTGDTIDLRDYNHISIITNSDADPWEIADPNIPESVKTYFTTN